MVGGLHLSTSPTVKAAILAALMLLSCGCLAAPGDGDNRGKTLQTELDAVIDPSHVLPVDGAEKQRYLEQAAPYLQAMHSAVRTLRGWFDPQQASVLRDSVKGLVWVEPQMLSAGNQHLRGAVIIRSTDRAEAIITRYAAEASGTRAQLDALVYSDDAAAFIPWRAEDYPDSCLACTQSASRWLGLFGDVTLTAAFWGASAQLCPAAVAATSLTGAGAVAVGLTCFATTYVLWDVSTRQYHRILQSWIAPSACKLVSRCGQGAGTICEAQGDQQVGWRNTVSIQVTSFEAAGRVEWRQQWRSDRTTQIDGQTVHPFDFLDVYVGEAVRTDADKLWAPRWWRALRQGAAVHQEATWLTPNKDLSLTLHDPSLNDQASVRLQGGATGDEDDVVLRAECRAKYE